MNLQRADQLIADPMKMLAMSNDELFAIDRKTAEAIQLGLTRKRFADLRSQIKVLDRLAGDVGVDRIDALEDVVPLCLPHTMYKSYSAAALEQGRFGKLNSWLDTLTAHDISGVDASRCESIEQWMDLLAAETPMRLVCSSGTGGKVSFFPRSTVEEKIRFDGWLGTQRRFSGERESPLESGHCDYFSPWPVATGRHNITENFRSIRERVFGGNSEGHFFTLGDGHWDIDLIWLDARRRAAESRGEPPPETPERLKPLLAAKRDRQAGSGLDLNRFVDELIVKRKGKTVFLFAPFLQMIAIAEECERRNIRAEWSEDSYVLTGGGGSGAKGFDFPDGWFELCKRVFPYEFHEMYGMTETTSSARKCSAGHYHMQPWATLFLLDPETSEPLPRLGTNTGRLALFDVMPTTFWGGAITGDRATITWDGDCACGRKGPYLHHDIARYSNLRDDDKITCARSPGAYERAMEFALGSLDMVEA